MFLDAVCAAGDAQLALCCRSVEHCLHQFRRVRLLRDGNSGVPPDVDGCWVALQESAGAVQVAAGTEPNAAAAGEPPTTNGQLQHADAAKVTKTGTLPSHFGSWVQPAISMAEEL